MISREIDIIAVRIRHIFHDYEAKMAVLLSEDSIKEDVCRAM